MSDLRKRTCIYYLKDAVKMLLMAIGIEFLGKCLIANPDWKDTDGKKHKDVYI